MDAASVPEATCHWGARSRERVATAPASAQASTSPATTVSSAEMSPADGARSPIAATASAARGMSTPAATRWATGLDRAVATAAGSRSVPFTPRAGPSRRRKPVGRRAGSCMVSGPR